MHPGIIVTAPAGAADSVARSVDAIRTADLHLTEEGLPEVLAALPAGRFDDVARLLRRPPAGTGDHLVAVVLGRYVAWSGDLYTADALRPLLQRVAAEPGGRAPAGHLVRHAALAAIERLASDLGDPRLAAQARATGRAGAAPGRSDAGVLAAALGVPDDDVVNPTDSAASGSGRTGTPDTPGPGSTPRRPDHDVAGHRFAMALLAFAHRDLGLDPDATRHRLRLRPRPDDLAVREIPCGDAAVSLEVRRAAGGVTLWLEQDSGAIPLTAVVEVRLPVAPVSCTVDGRTADLAPRPEAGGGVLLPVQLVLDAPRRLGIVVAGGA